MKKLNLCLVFIFIIQVYCAMTFVLAQEDISHQQIKNTLEAFMNTSLSRDINSAMKFVSSNYSSNFYYQNKKIMVDYNKFRLILEQVIANVAIKFVDLSLINVKVSELDIQGNKANLKFEYVVKVFNLVSLEDEVIKSVAAVSLEKEGDNWKIISWDALNKPAQ